MVQKPLLGSNSAKYRQVVASHCTGFLFQSSLFAHRKSNQDVVKEQSQDTFVVVDKEKLYKYRDFL